MCNLSQGIKERTKREVLVERDTMYILNMYQKGLSLEQITEIAEKPLAEVEEIISSR